MKFWLIVICVVGGVCSITASAQTGNPALNQELEKKLKAAASDSTAAAAIRVWNQERSPAGYVSTGPGEYIRGSSAAELLPDLSQGEDFARMLLGFSQDLNRNTQVVNKLASWEKNIDQMLGPNPQNGVLLQVEAWERPQDETAGIGDIYLLGVGRTPEEAFNAGASRQGMHANDFAQPNFQPDPTRSFRVWYTRVDGHLQARAVYQLLGLNSFSSAEDALTSMKPGYQSRINFANEQQKRADDLRAEANQRAAQNKDQEALAASRMQAEQAAAADSDAKHQQTIAHFQAQKDEATRQEQVAQDQEHKEAWAMQERLADAATRAEQKQQDEDHKQAEAHQKQEQANAEAQRAQHQNEQQQLQQEIKNAQDKADDAKKKAEQIKPPDKQPDSNKGCDGNPCDNKPPDTEGTLGRFANTDTPPPPHSPKINPYARPTAFQNMLSTLNNGGTAAAFADPATGRSVTFSRSSTGQGAH